MVNIGETYDETWEREEFINWSRFEHTLRLIPESDDNIKISDIAAGPGYFSDFLIQKTPIKKDSLTCFDISSFAIQKLRKKDYHAHILDIEESPTPEPTDLIFFLEAIEHVFEPDKVFNNLYKSLKPGGYLVISTPNYAKFNLRIKMLFGIIPEKYTSGNHHVSLFSVDFLKQRLKFHGFEIDAENNLFQMESLGKLFRKFLKPLFPFLQKKFPLPNYNYIPTYIFPNLISDIVLIRARKPLNE